MSSKYTIGLDYGTNSVRALVVDASNGREIGTAVWNYEHGDAGVILARDPNLARQHPADYLKGAEIALQRSLADAQGNVRGFKAEQVAGLGVDTTGSTPLPVDARGQPLALQKKFSSNPAAMAWLWKDHTERRRSRRNYRARQENPAAISRQMRRRLLQRMVLEQNPALPPDRAPSV